MAHTDDQLFKHATKIAEQRILTARAHQSREAAKVVQAVVAWFLCKTSRTGAASTLNAKVLSKQ